MKKLIVIGSLSLLLSIPVFAEENKELLETKIQARYFELEWMKLKFEKVNSDLIIYSKQLQELNKKEEEAKNKVESEKKKETK
jgi:hypothetical protein